MLFVREYNKIINDDFQTYLLTIMSVYNNLNCQKNSRKTVDK